MTIGKPYYPTGLENSIKENWTATFQALCISAETDAKAKIAAALSKAHDLGCNKQQTEQLVEQLLPKLTKHRAELISRTETGKLNNAATMATYKGADIEYYK